MQHCRAAAAQAVLSNGQLQCCIPLHCMRDRLDNRHGTGKMGAHSEPRQCGFSKSHGERDFLYLTPPGARCGSSNAERGLGFLVHCVRHAHCWRLRTRVYTHACTHARTHVTHTADGCARTAGRWRLCSMWNGNPTCRWRAHPSRPFTRPKQVRLYTPTQVAHEALCIRPQLHNAFFHVFEYLADPGIHGTATSVSAP